MEPLKDYHILTIRACKNCKKDNLVAWLWVIYSHIRCWNPRFTKVEPYYLAHWMWEFCQKLGIPEERLWHAIADHLRYLDLRERCSGDKPSSEGKEFCSVMVHACASVIRHTEVAKLPPGYTAGASWDWYMHRSEAKTAIREVLKDIFGLKGLQILSLPEEILEDLIKEEPYDPVWWKDPAIIESIIRSNRPALVVDTEEYV
jgi:hypothetical protein